MIRAVFENGAIRPLEPVPAEWQDGQPLVVEPVRALADDDEPDAATWFAELAQLGGAQYEPGEREEIEALMREADETAKAWVRQQMNGL